jgi:excisionase family DNA binding protein
VPDQPGPWRCIALKRLLSVGEVARLLGVSSSTVYRWYERGGLTGTKVGRLVRFSEEDITSFLGGQRSSRASSSKAEFPTAAT